MKYAKMLFVSFFISLIFASPSLAQRSVNQILADCESLEDLEGVSIQRSVYMNCEKFTELRRKIEEHKISVKIFKNMKERMPVMLKESKEAREKVEKALKRSRNKKVVRCSLNSVKDVHSKTITRNKFESCKIFKLLTETIATEIDAHKLVKEVASSEKELQEEEKEIREKLREAQNII